MKIDITRGEKTVGFIKKTKQYTVTLTVLFSDEEKQVIKEAKFEKYVLVERPVRAGIKDNSMPDIWHLRVSKLLDGKPDEYEFDTIVEENDYNDALMPALKNLKNNIIVHGRPVENTSVEL